MQEKKMKYNLKKTSLNLSIKKKFKNKKNNQ